MKITVLKPVEIEVKSVLIQIPIRYGTEDIPNDFPLRRGDVWEATVDIDTGKIEKWPLGESGQLLTKVCDGGSYTLLDAKGAEVGRVADYVPHGLIPGQFGDYIELRISKNGTIVNWPVSPNLSRFFEGEE